MFATSDPRELNSVAVQLQSQGRCREALHAFVEAARLYRRMGDARGEGRCLNGAGACCKDMGEVENARTYLENALKLRVRTGDQLGEAITLTTLGPIYQLSGKPDEAQRALNKALRLTDALGAYDRRGQVLFNLADVAETSGRLAQARTWYEEAREVAGLNGDDVEMAKCIGGLTNVSIRLGLTAEAFDLAQQWLEQSAGIGHARGVSCALHALGTLYFETKDYEAAKRALEESISIDTRTGAPAEAAISMSLLAEVLHTMGRRGEARAKAEEALASAQRLGALDAEMSALQSLGAILGDAGDHRRALDTYEQCVSAARRAGARLDEAWALTGKALMLEKLQDRPAALARLAEAADILDSIRGDISHQKHRLTFFAQRGVQSVYGIYIDLLLKEHAATGAAALAERAFAVRERANTRALLDFLYAKGLGDHRPPLASPPITLAETQALLDGETALIEYSVHTGVSYAFIVTRDRLAVVKLPAAIAIRETIAPRLGGGIVPGSANMLRSASQSLGAMVFDPLVPYLGGRKRLIVVAHDVLSIVPFQMLRSAAEPASYLAASYTISYAPSASTLRALRRARSRPRPMEFLGLAPVCDDDLPKTRDEVTRIAGAFGGKATIRLAGEAKKTDLFALRTGDYRFVHFATHGLCNVADENGSALVMNGTRPSEMMLYTYEIADLALDADLVVLSACETGLGVVTHGEGLLGLTRAFLCAGADSVCASLWKVDDEATSELMVRFYGHVRSGDSPVDALRKAQLALLDDPRWCDPVYWAAFVLVGKASS